MTEPLRIPNSRGQLLAAVAHHPATPAGKLAILCPGFLDSKEYPHLTTLADELAARGYTAVRFDPTGTWESEGGIEEYLTSQYVRDIGSALEFMLARRAYGQVLVGGHSRGGQVSVLYAAHDPRVTAVLGIMPSHGPVSGARRDEWEAAGFYAASRSVPGKPGERREYRVPFSHVLDRDGFDALADIRMIHAPVILLAGALDDIVTPQEVGELYDAANEPKKLLVVEGIGHDYRRNPAEIAAVNERILGALPA